MFDKYETLTNHENSANPVIKCVLQLVKDSISRVGNKKFIALFQLSKKMTCVDALWPSDTYIAAHPSDSNGFDMDTTLIYDDDWACEETFVSYYDETETDVFASTTGNFIIIMVDQTKKMNDNAINDK